MPPAGGGRNLIGGGDFGSVPSPSPQLVAFGLLIRKARRDLDLTQEAFATLAGLNAKHVGEIERAKKEPRLSTVLKLARALNMPGDELLKRFGEQPDSTAR